jgi:sugar lactone lactonase YvrE
MRYEVAADGSLYNGSVFLSAVGEKAKGGPDGLKMDRAGNLYSLALVGSGSSRRKENISLRFQSLKPSGI